MVDPSALSDADLMALISGPSTPAPINAISSAPVNPLSALSDRDLLSAINAPTGAASNNPTGDTIANVASQFGKGLTFGWLDEAAAVSAATENSISSLFGGGNGGTWSQNYNELVNQQRGADEAYQKQNPKTAMALNIAGGVAPALLTLGGSAPAAAPSVLKSGLGTLFGIGSKAAPTLGQLP